MRYIAVAAACLVTDAALADPLPLPQTDYSATYLVQPGGRSMAMAHHEGRMRVEMTPSMTGIADLKTNKMILLMKGPQLMAMEIDMNQTLPAMEGMPGMDTITPQQIITDTDVTLTEIGRKTIAGLGCTLYDAIGTTAGKPVKSKLCLTPDNVVLFVETLDRAKTYTMTATVVTIAPQDPSQFQVPPGTPIMNMEDMLRGMSTSQ